jgi:hypothetical protein
VVLAAFGLGYGAAGAGAVGVRAEPPPPSGTPAPPRDVGAGSRVRSAGPEDGPGPVSLEELKAAASRVSALRAAVDALDPKQESWPDEAPTRLQPGPFEDHVLAALEAAGAGALQAMDCDEYPCVATLTIAEPLPGATPAEELKRLMDVRAELEDRLGMGVHAHLEVHPDGTWLTLAASPEGVNGLRLANRLESLWIDASR